MKIHKNERIDQLFRFRNQFNNNLTSAIRAYEEKFGKNTQINNEPHKIIKNKTTSEIIKAKSIKIKHHISKSKTKFGLEDHKRSKTEIIQNKINVWKPAYMICDYFEKFKRLKPKYELNTWEKVII